MTIRGLDLYRDSWVIIAWSGNSEIGDALTMEQLAELPWIVSSYRPAAFGRVTRQLAAVGIEPRIDLVVDNYLSLPLLVAGTDRLALIQERLAHRLAGCADVRILRCPYDAEPIVEAMWGHPMHQRAAGHTWLREFFADVGRKLAPSQS